MLSSQNISRNIKNKQLKIQPYCINDLIRGVPLSKRFNNYIFVCKTLKLRASIDNMTFKYFRFDCPKITDLAGDKCYFNKDVLNIGDRLDGEKTSALCAAGCFCEK